MFFPFRDEFDAAFREDRKLVWKLLGAAVVGLCLGLKVWLGIANDKHGGAVRCALLLGGAVAVSLVAVFALSLSDTVKRRISEGQPVNAVLRYYLAHGALSLMLWVATVIVGTFLVLILWGSWLG